MGNVPLVMGIKKAKKSQKPFDSTGFIVGIGASAGGLEAITDLFENMPENTGFSFILIQHISPDHKSLMPELLARHTTMSTTEGEDGMMVKPNCIYIIPSGKFMTIQFGKLRLQEKLKSKLPNNAIDIFFESLAVDSKECAIGIILSGTGTDGTKGIAAIKENGGSIIVQDPTSAAFDGMPNSAIATGLADVVSVPELMAEQLVILLNESPQVQLFTAEKDRAEVVLRNILQEIRKAIGLDFSYYKRPTLFRRLAKRMSELGISGLQDYLDYLNKHSDEVTLISKEFLINVSSFFRDKEAFSLLSNIAIPAIIKNKQADDTIKVWSVACSTGEEAYSIAILFNEYLRRHKLHDHTIKIFATDIDTDALETASRGIYPKSIAVDIPPDYLSMYFIQENNTYRIHPDIRKMVVFSYHNILKDPPYSRMDLVSCRNMLIYIHAEQQADILKKLHFAMNLDGYLLLGSSENIGSIKDGVQEIDKKWKLYKCISKLPLKNHDSIFSTYQKRVIPQLPISKVKNMQQHIPELFNQAIVEENKIAGIFINADFEIKQAVGNYKNFLSFPDTGFNFNLLKLVPQDLSIALSIAIRKAIKDNVKITAKDIKLKENDVERHINIVVKPYLQQKEYMQAFLLVLIIEAPGEGQQTGKYISGDNLEAEQQISILEKELYDTRENLQALIEEVETSNEELQSSNEEMVSTNEELQSTNEELQSLNEELHTVSAEHQQKIKELTELNDDLNNYFGNSDIGQILIDSKFIIRKFTPAVTKMINLISSDLNRSIADITTRIKSSSLLEDIKWVMATNVGVEKEITLNNNAVYLMRINPYVRQDGSVDGMVINFIDVTEVKKLTSIVEAIFNSSSSAIDAKKVIRNEKNEIIDFEYVTANAELENVLNVKRDSLIGKRLSKIAHGLGSDYPQLLKKVFDSGEPEQYHFHDMVNSRWYEVGIVKIMDGVVTTLTDITLQKQAAERIARSFEDLKVASGKLKDTNTQLERSNMDLMQFASVASHDLKEPLRKIQTFGNMLHTKVKGKFEDTELNYLEKIIKSSHRMQTLIEDVLTLSKLSNQEIPFTRVDLNNTLHRIEDDLEITISEKKAEITVDKLPVINGVQGQMHQLFQNLISNALKFNDTKQPTIYISVKPVPSKTAKELNIEAKNYNCISVKDNGIGFEDEFNEKIFGIFQRLNGNQYDGTGIGLAICRKIVENHHGFLLANSVLGKGTEFWVILPK